MRQSEVNKPYRDGSRFYWALVDNAITDEADLATLQAINADSLRQVLAEFPFAPMTIVGLGPKNQ